MADVDPAFQRGRWRWSDERIGWLLRVNRRYGPRRRYAKGSAFAADLRVGADVGVAPSQVSRWESGQTPVRYEIVRGYEDTLGLPETSLVNIADGLNRQVTIGLRPSRLDRHVARDPEDAAARAEALLERALSGDTMGGRDWDDLTSLLTGLERVLLRPRDWHELAGRLLTEQVVANGENWRRRQESMHRLLSLPRARPHVIDACASWVRDPGSQVLIEPLSLLDMASDASANHLLLEQLVSPVNGQALRGALLGSIGKVRFGHYPPDQLRRVVGVVTELLLDPALAAGARPLAAELLRQLPADVRPGTFQRLRAALAVADGLPPAVVESAACHLGHLPGSSDDTYWRRALGRHRAGWQRNRSDHAVSSLRGLTYALGLAGRQEPLAAVRRDPQMPPAVRVAARWWQNLPSAVVASAAR